LKNGANSAATLPPQTKNQLAGNKEDVLVLIDLSKKKVCFKCGRLMAMEDFYKHKQMADGRLNKCKECTKKDVHENYKEKREYYAKYERMRFQNPLRKEKVFVYMQRRRANNPEKYKSRCSVRNAIRDGRLKKKPCEVCGCVDVEAHHPDYSKPLDVVWLCRKHHLEEHGKQAYVFNDDRVGFSAVA